MNRIVVPLLPRPGERIAVDRPGSHHLLRVQRLARGASVVATDAGGGRAHCTLVDVADGLAVLEVVVVLPARPHVERIVLLGLPRGPAVDEALTLGTEAGATQFRLVRAQRSPPGQLRLDRLDRVLRAAVTQCGRADRPAIEQRRSVADALDPLPLHRFVATPGGGSARRTTEPAVVAVGPEGGWDPDEQQALVDAGFIPIGLGPFILRTPTAVLAALVSLWHASPD